MGHVDPRDYGLGRGRTTVREPVLTPAVLGDVDAAVLTIKEARMGIIANGRKTGLLAFEEIPQHVFWLTLRCIQTLLNRLGQDTDLWIGARVPLLKVQVENPKTGETVVKYNVAPYEEWDAVMEELDHREAEAATKKVVKSARARRG